eukprot:2077832-Ditylum_brightwellii.AAC.1
MPRLHAMIYKEDEGERGRSNAISMLMVVLDNMKLLDGQKWKRLSVIADKCTGQNKNNMVFCLCTYLMSMGYFQGVEFIFLIAGHTKNSVDCLCSKAKKKYHDTQVFTMQ